MFVAYGPRTGYYYLLYTDSCLAVLLPALVSTAATRPQDVMAASQNTHFLLLCQPPTTLTIAFLACSFFFPLALFPLFKICNLFHLVSAHALPHRGAAS